MKKAVFIAFLAAGIYSCNSGSSDGVEANKDSALTSTPGIPNVNGNVPDTTNSISLDKTTTDTTTKKGQY